MTPNKFKKGDRVMWVDPNGSLEGDCSGLGEIIKIRRGVYTVTNDRCGTIDAQEKELHVPLPGIQIPTCSAEFPAARNLRSGHAWKHPDVDRSNVRDCVRCIHCGRLIPEVGGHLRLPRALTLD